MFILPLCILYTLILFDNTPKTMFFSESFTSREPADLAPVPLRAVFVGDRA